MITPGNTRAVIFDLDGVLADSEGWWMQIDDQMLSHYGVRYHGEHKQAMLGLSFALSMEFYKKAFHFEADTDEMIRRRQEIAADYFASKIEPFPAVFQVLRDLRHFGLRIGLATSSVASCARPFLDRHQLTPFFDGIVTGDEVTRGKPAPHIYLLAASKIGVEPAFCLVVEDALAGIAAGKAAGMRVAAVPDARYVDVRAYTGVADWILPKLDGLSALIRVLNK